MPWTDEDEANFQREKAAWFEKEAKEDEDHRKLVEMGFAPKCPQCGSHRYIEATWSEQCDDCGYSQGY